MVESDSFPQASGDALQTDSKPADLGFGDGGVPILLLLFYLCFLVFFTWYTVEKQLPAFQAEGPVPLGESAPVDEAQTESGQ